MIQLMIEIKEGNVEQVYGKPGGIFSVEIMNHDLLIIDPNHQKEIDRQMDIISAEKLVPLFDEHEPANKDICPLKPGLLDSLALPLIHNHALTREGRQLQLLDLAFLAGSMSEDIGISRYIMKKLHGSEQDKKDASILHKLIEPFQREQNVQQGRVIELLNSGRYDVAAKEYGWMEGNEEGQEDTNKQQ